MVPHSFTPRGNLNFRIVNSDAGMFVGGWRKSEKGKPHGHEENIRNSFSITFFNIMQSILFYIFPNPCGYHF